MSEEQLTAGEKLRLEPGTLWTRVIATTEYAIQCGALHSIPTEYEFVEEKGINFLVRILSNLVRKDEAKKQQKKKTDAAGKEFNPFLPYEEDLFVADISDTHVCLLNKFNVVEHHLLMITREFEEQESCLNLADFEAMSLCLAEIDGLAFYNGGQIAGASQRHKHLQLVPFPLIPNGLKIPIAEAILGANFDHDIGTIASFPFVNAIALLNPDHLKSPLVAAQSALESYHTLLSSVGLTCNGNKQSGAYNLLATREWMLIVPRSQEDFQSIGINSLGFAGALLVRNAQQMNILKEYGPLTLLKNVAQSDTNFI